MPKIVFQTAMAISYGLAPLQLPISTNYKWGKHFHSWFSGSYFCYIFRNETYRLQLSVCQHDYLRNSLPKYLKFKSILEDLVSN